MKKRSLLLPALLLLWFLLSAARLSETQQALGKLQLEQALHRAAVSCYATEGAYPPDVAYLQDHYGLRYDEKRYVVRYQRTAANWMPDITVLERSP